MDRLGVIRLLLIVALAVTGYLLLLRWQADYGGATDPLANATSAPSVQAIVPPSATDSDSEPMASSSAAPSSSVQNDFSANVMQPDAADDALPPLVEVKPGPHAINEPMKTESDQSKLFTVTTSTLSVQIDPLGGDIVVVKFPLFPDTQGSPNPFTLLSTQHPFYKAQSGILSDSGLDLGQKGRPIYHSDQQTAQFQESDTLRFPLTFENERLRVTKTYQFERNSYVIRLDTQVTNLSDSPWRGRFFAQIHRDGSRDPSEMKGGFGLPTFNGAAYWSPEKRYNKLKFDDLEEGFQTNHTGGWIAWVQHYFLSAWIPDVATPLNVVGRKTTQGYAISYTEAVPTTVNPGETIHFSSRLYAGPKIEKDLSEIADGLYLAVDYGFLFMISKALLSLLKFIESYVGNWGVAIILLTLFVKALFLWPSAISYRSMARMRKLQPHLARLKEECGQDRQRMSQEMIKLYKKEKVNPFGGCLPVLMQMPVFIALYWALLESVELRQAPFFGWIQDLSVMDPYFVLPLLMGVSMFVQTSLNPAPPDPTQAKVMKLMPIVFTVFFLFFPAGLVLYWLTNNVLSIIQQWIITRRVESSA
ncbi:MAG: membrane protein insertase YidC [Gammaproteobacteria bacterium]